MTTTPPPSSPRTTLSRHPERGDHDPEAIRAFLDSQFLCHFAFQGPDGPLCIPTCYGRIGDWLYIHGALASRVMSVGKTKALPICVTVTRVDGVVVAKSAFHHSMNFCSVMVHGEAETVSDFEEKAKALAAITDRVVPGRWDECRPATDAEINATGVLRLSLAEASLKARTGGPVEAKEDLTGPQWSGVLPVTLVAGQPEPVAEAEVPPSVALFLAQFAPPS
ncbi:pyridoxamine 5'-phosphate oxidase family protein [Rhodospirillum sp. A1_3_36]|uniref:pyridoxamine 5'-phosphate oxidase family protein n=1 Tax=Rhodospirillum sp. A1_3_36 TaxID=3391666 RepID=UPI0039A53C0B